jgi:hypothetical protein
MRRHYSTEGQRLFDNYLIGLFFIAKWTIEGLIYSPFILTAYIITTHILHRHDHALLWLALTGVFAFVLFCIFSLLLVQMRELRNKKNSLWLPIYVLYVSYTCILPVYIVFKPIEHLVREMTHETSVTLLSWIFCVVFGSVVYNRYHFLER